MSYVCERPVPVAAEFAEILQQLESSDLVRLQEDISAYECGRSVGMNLQDVLNRAECLAEANRIMVRFRREESRA